MLDDWTEEDATEIIEVGSGMFVILLVFVLGFIASVMWFWPHMSLQMKKRFVRVLPCCLSIDDVEMEESSTHSEAMSSTHSSTPFTPAQSQQEAHRYSHDADEVQMQTRHHQQQRHQQEQQRPPRQQWQWQSGPPDQEQGGYVPEDQVSHPPRRQHPQHHRQHPPQHPQQTYNTPQQLPHITPAPSANTQPQGYTDPDTYTDTNNSDSESTDISFNQSRASHPPRTHPSAAPRTSNSAPRDLVVKLPPPTSQPRNVPSYGSPPPSQQQQQQQQSPARGADRAPRISKAKAGGSSYANKYNSNL